MILMNHLIMLILGMDNRHYRLSTGKWLSSSRIKLLQT